MGAHVWKIKFYAACVRLPEACAHVRIECMIGKTVLCYQGCLQLNSVMTNPHSDRKLTHCSREVYQYMCLHVLTQTEMRMMGFTIKHKTHFKTFFSLIKQKYKVSITRLSTTVRGELKINHKNCSICSYISINWSSDVEANV